MPNVDTHVEKYPIRAANSRSTSSLNNHLFSPELVTSKKGSSVSDNEISRKLNEFRSRTESDYDICLTKLDKTQNEYILRKSLLLPSQHSHSDIMKFLKSKAK